MSDAALKKLRAIIARWPETDERISHGAPTWWGGRKTFATLHASGSYAPLSVWCLQPKEMQADIIASNPELFFVPKYVGHRGWVGIRLDREDTPWTLVEDMLERGYRMVAPKRALKKLDEG